MTVDVYACGSPIRIPLLKRVAHGVPDAVLHPEANPLFLNNPSVVWGLIRGARNIIRSCQDAGLDFWQVDNAYFGREKYFRITLNGLQLKDELPFTDGSRFSSISAELGLEIRDWRVKRGSQILVCLSTHMLYEYYGLHIQDWLAAVIKAIRRVTDRPIKVREKQTSGITSEILQSWIVVTHTSAASIDSLRLGVPVIVTGDCAASRFSTRMENVEEPLMPDGREKLFYDLSWRQFRPQEFSSGLAWDIVSRQRHDPQHT